MKTRTPIIPSTYSIVMDYKPYSMEWSRKRYLAEAIQQYFESGASTVTIVDDIVDVLEQNANQYRSRADKIQEVLNSIKTY